MPAGSPVDYGDRQFRPSGRPVEGLVRTILSQNTSDTNSGRAFDSLVERFGDMDRVRKAPARSIEVAIRAGGLAKTKSVRIKRILEEIHRREGSLNLDRLSSLPPLVALAELTAFAGVGAKTAHCVLLFDLGMPVFPVDTHVLRISARLGWIPERTSMEKAHVRLNEIVPHRLAHALHVNLIQYGREICRPRPRCAQCVLSDLCLWEGRATR